MSALVVEPKTIAAAVQRAFSGRSRWAAAVILVIGPLLQVTEFLLENASGDNAARVALWAGHPTQVELAMTSGLLAVPFLLGGIACW